MKRRKTSKLVINKTTVRVLAGRQQLAQAAGGRLPTNADDCVSMDLCTSNFTWKCAPDQ